MQSCKAWSEFLLLFRFLLLAFMVLQIALKYAMKRAVQVMIFWQRSANHGKTKSIPCLIIPGSSLPEWAWYLAGKVELFRSYGIFMLLA